MPPFSTLASFLFLFSYLNPRQLFSKICRSQCSCFDKRHFLVLTFSLGFLVTFELPTPTPLLRCIHSVLIFHRVLMQECCHCLWLTVSKPPHSTAFAFLSEFWSLRNKAHGSLTWPELFVFPLQEKRMLAFEILSMFLHHALKRKKSYCIRLQCLVDKSTLMYSSDL